MITCRSFSCLSQNAPIKFNALVMKETFMNQGYLFELVQNHYTDEAVGQVHRIVGSADVLGNPVALFKTFSSGVGDFFYEPIQGFVSANPEDFGVGLAKVMNELNRCIFRV